MKENLKPYVYKLWNTYIRGEPRTFCRTVRRVVFTGKVKHLRCGAEGKPSLNRARGTLKSTKESVEADPKPGDLSMSRLKLL